MATVFEKLTALADGIRGLSGTSSAKGLDDMTSDVNEANAEILRQVELLEQIIAALESKSAERLEGDGQEFHAMAPSALSFRSSAPLNEFVDVKINGEIVDHSNYTLEEGSTIVTFPINYLQGLLQGNYEVTVQSESKAVKGGFTVIDPEINNYGFYYNQPYSGYVSLFGEDEVFFIREGGVMDVIGAYSGTTSEATYTVSGKNMTIVSPIAGTLTGVISDDGMSIYCNELGVTFTITKDAVAADSNYLYIYKDEVNGYLVSCFNKNNSAPGVIKSSINNRDVVGIAPAGFSNSSITSIVIPTHIKDIGMFAFKECNNLKSISLPEGLTYIGQNTFENCVSLESITIPDGVAEIHTKAFQNCSKLTTIVIPGSVTAIGWYAFQNCSLLTFIAFKGTMAQWNAITKDSEWNSDIPASYVTCTDGLIEL